MENFMDRLYSKISSNGTQQYTASAEPRRRDVNDNKVEQLMNLVRENDSKQVECISAMFDQESYEQEQSKQIILKNIQESQTSVQHSVQEVRNDTQKSLQETNGFIQQTAQETQSSLQTINSAMQNIDASVRSISECVQQNQTAQSEGIVAGGITTEQYQDLEEHIHKENVKCYRNVQASVMEQAELQMEQTRTSVGPVKGMLVTSLILNVATIAILIVHLIGVI